MFDSHCHLASPQLAADFDGVVERAIANDVTGFINIGDNIASSIAAGEQATRAMSNGTRMWSTTGVHPQQALEFDSDTTQTLRELCQHPLVCAIGEIGLDFVYDETHPQYPGATRAIQAAVLRQQLDLAIEVGLPVVMHNREADETLLEIMREYAPRLCGGVFHCFGSSLAVARRVLDLGFYLGFTGLVTFKNAEAVREVARFCPLDRLLIETDAPYLAPVPYRGKTNEPSYLPRVAETLAGLHGLEVQELVAITQPNTQRLFRLDAPQM